MTGNWSPPVGAGTESSWFFFLVPSHPSVSLLCQCLGEVKSKYILCGVPPKTGEVVTLPALPIPMKVNTSWFENSLAVQGKAGLEEAK